MELLLVGFVLMIIVGAICGLIAVGRISGLKSQLLDMERRLARLSAQLDQSGPIQAAPEVPAPTPHTPDPEPAREPAPAPEPAPMPREDPWTSPPAVARAPEQARTPLETPEPNWLAGQIKDNWMIWLGGFCVALAGIFLAKYSIEQGLLGPGARISLGVATGATLHAAAEWLRRRTGEAHPAFAALAGGGSITLFAVTLASLHLYDMITPTAAFIVLAIVALLTMCLAWLYGPVLAAIGIVGAYIVPLLVSSGEGRVLIALGYALVISASALLLMRYVFRPWLWWGFVAGALGWWLITLGDYRADGARSFYLAAVGYLMLALPNFDWRLRQVVELAEEKYDLDLWRKVTPPLERLYPVVFLLLAVAQTISIVAETTYESAFWLWSPLPLLFLIVARHRETLLFMPAVLLVFTALAWLAPNVHSGEIKLLAAPDDRAFLIYLAGTAVLFSALSLRNLATNRFKAVWSSLATLAPLLLLTLAYVMTSRLLVSWQWGTIAILFAIVYLGVASVAVKRSSIDSLVVWLFFGGHFAFSLAAVMVLHEAQLTLAIAAQLISTAWIINRFQLPGLDWIVKLIVTIVIVRLTLNPWLASYPPDFHWSLWAYGGTAVCAGVATWMLRPLPAIARWTEAATLHLVVLTVWAELRYWMHDGAVFADKIEFLEVCIYVALFAVMGVVYYRRSLASENLAWLYRLFSRLLLAVSAASYAIVLLATIASLGWVWREIGATPVFNLTLLAYGAPVIVGLLVWWFGEPAVRRPGIVFAGAALFIYISIQVRHIWQTNVRFDVPASDGELYTYSAVWLVMAFAAILGGTWRLGKDCYRAGMLLLAMVIGKLFLIDMAGLEGLYRVASFMGLGLGLLGISYLHQRIQRLGVKLT